MTRCVKTLRLSIQLTEVLNFENVCSGTFRLTTIHTILCKKWNPGLFSVNMDSVFGKIILDTEERYTKY